MNDWKQRHIEALNSPVGFEMIGRMVWDWNLYRLVYEERYESKMAWDYVLGPAWAKIGEGLLTLLNGDLGRLDAGMLDGTIRDALSEAGFNSDTGEPSE